MSAKFLLLVLGILIILFGILATVLIGREARLLSRKAAEQEHALASAIIADLRDSMLSGKPRNTLNLMRILRESHGLLSLQILREDGTPAFGVPGARVALPQVGAAFHSGQDTDVDGEDPLPNRTHIVPLRNESACRRCHRAGGTVLGVLLLSHSREDAAREFAASRRWLLSLFTGMLLVMGGALYTGVRRLVLVPLRNLHRGADTIGSGDLEYRIPVTGRDEFADLAVAFNEMAARLQETRAGLENTVKMRTAELNESVQLMRGILSSMSSGVALLTRDGEVKLLNRQGAVILGRSDEDLLGRRLTELVPETQAFLDAGAKGRQEIAVQAPGGGTVPVGFTSSPFPAGDGKAEGIIVVFQDLTELKALRAELLEKERLAAIGKVAAGVAHEIRNPLFGISAIGQIFQRDLKDPAFQELSRALLAETKRLNLLVEDLLLYGRPNKLKLEQADLRILWEEVLDLHREELKRRNIRVTGDYAARHPVVAFDPHQIRQVFLNVLRNALEATPDGGAISITMLLEDNGVLFRVADTGAGIPKDHLPHVFDLFYTTKPSGSGLGLAICRKILEDHGGDILIASEEGKGTSVTVRLPSDGAAAA